MATINIFYDSFVQDPSKEDTILQTASLELTGKDLDVLKKRIEGKKQKDAKDKGKKSVAESSFVDVKKPEADEDVPQNIIDSFWAELEKLDPTTLISDDVLDAFKYIGFDPEIVLKELLKRGKKADKDRAAITKDMVDIITIAIIKGSVTEKNLKKTSDSGKVMYKRLQDVYQLETGGTKGKDSTHLTVARVAAAVPGIVVQVLVKKPAYAKTFIGPFGSKSLPPYLKHQAAAACVPETASEKLKEFILGLITAYTADQSKTLSKTKDSAEELFDNQLNYVMTTHGSKHPSEEHRAKIFKEFSLSSDYEKLQSVALRVKKVKSDFVVLTQQQLDEELAK